MDILGRTKINSLMDQWPKNTVAITKFFEAQDISNQLLAIYKKNKWVRTIGRGAYIRFSDTPPYLGAIYALQKLGLMSIHPGGKTALSLLGKSHYLELSQKRAYLFGSADERPPSWVQGYDWKVKLDYNQTSFMPPNLGLTEYNMGEYSVSISDPIRAFLECLLLTPKDQDIVECYEIIEGLTDLRPDKINHYLLECSSIKVKRLFLYLAEKADHSWFQYINVDSLDLGKGKRSLVDNGIFSNKYKITVPKTLKEHGKPVL